MNTIQKLATVTVLKGMMLYPIQVAQQSKEISGVVQ